MACTVELFSLVVVSLGVVISTSILLLLAILTVLGADSGVGDIAIAVMLFGASIIWLDISVADGIFY